MIFVFFVLKKENNFWKYQPNKPLMTHFSFIYLFYFFAYLFILLSVFIFKEIKIFFKKIKKIKLKNVLQTK